MTLALWALREKHFSLVKLYLWSLIFRQSDWPDAGYRWQCNAGLEIKSIPTSPRRLQCYAGTSVIVNPAWVLGFALVFIRPYVYAYAYYYYHASSVLWQALVIMRFGSYICIWHVQGLLALTFISALFALHKTYTWKKKFKIKKRGWKK